MSYYVEHGAHYNNVSEYYTELRVIVKCLSSAIISFKYAREHACISVCVCVQMCVYYFVGYIHVLKL